MSLTKLVERAFGQVVRVRDLLDIRPVSMARTPLISQLGAGVLSVLVFPAMAVAVGSRSKG